MGGWKGSWAWRLIVTGWGVVSLPLTAVAILVGAPFLGPKRSFWTFGPLWSRSVFWFFGMHLQLEGWEELPAEIREGRQPVVFMGNHESILDPPVLIGSLPTPAVYLSKKEILWMVPIGWAAMMAGTIFIDRSNREKAVQSIKDAAAEIRGGKSVVIFPEGTRTRTGEMLNFKKGGFALATDAGAPIVPFGIGGAYEMLPPGKLLVRPARYTIVVGQPVHPADYATKEDLSAEVRIRIVTLRATARERAGVAQTILQGIQQSSFRP